jgi:drug/metabolite transporter (DMT)-like permease
VLFAVAACGLWALAFVSPVVLEGFSPFLAALGRYAMFGLISLVLAPFVWRQVRALRRADWVAAALLSSIGNVAFYVLLAAAIQLVDVPAPTGIVGLLPLTIPLVANWRRREQPWRTLAAPLAGIGLGLLLVTTNEYQRLLPVLRSLAYLGGLGLATAALASWTWYGVTNALWLQSRPHVDAAAWTIAQGVTVLPLVAIGFAAWASWNSSGPPALHFHPGAGGDVARFLVVIAVVGLGPFWLATLCTHASRLLPTTLAGQLIVYETVAAVAYGHVYRGTWPSVAVLLGVMLLCCGVALGVRALHAPRSPRLQ